MNNKFNKILISKKNKYTIVSMANFNSENDFLNDVAEKINKGADIVEFKPDNLSANDFLSLSIKLRELTAMFDVLLIIYDRIDIAKLIAADGIMLDKNTITIELAKKLTENNMLIGYFCNNNNEAKLAQEKNADFIVSKEKYENLTIHNYICIK